MERPLYGKDTQNASLEAGDAGRIEDRAAKLKLAGHISLQERNHSGEVSLRPEAPRTVHVPGVAQFGNAGENRPTQGPAFRPVQFSQAPKTTMPEAPAVDVPQPDRIERSAWHSIALDAEGQVMQTTHGAAFQQETRPEQMVADAAQATQPDDSQSTQSTIGPAFQQSNSQQVSPTTLSPQPVFQQPQPTQQQFAPHSQQQVVYEQQLPQQPTYTTQPTNQQPFYAPAQPTQQPVQQYQQPTSTPPLTGAVNPSFPAMPTQPTLPTGQPTHADPQHLLSGSKKSLFKSPWLWLAIGLAMIIYFGTSLF